MLHDFVSSNWLRVPFFMLAVALYQEPVGGATYKQKDAAAKLVTGDVRTITFSGFSWWVKSSTRPVGPGPCMFSDSEDNVWVDTNGKLHIKITYREGRWSCAEVVCTRALNYGTYRFYLETAPADIDRNVVLGLFTWSDDPAFNHREIDVEISDWGNKLSTNNCQFVVQPYKTAGRMTRFEVPKHLESSIHSFTWEADRIEFCSTSSSLNFSNAAGGTIREWVFSKSNIPKAGEENARMNLWLIGGLPPSNSLEQEVIISKFEFLPSSSKARAARKSN